MNYSKIPIRRISIALIVLFIVKAVLVGTARAQENFFRRLRYFMEIIEYADSTVNTVYSV
ncbi:hypothetical protein NRK67_03950 [Fusobacteria bacterium ZRK30]|nr:hypothetical protein NRK67_03950 [Fusobacteria bacterium ZRK30]